MTPDNDDAIDALLRAGFDGPVADDGFTDRLMRRLPPRRRPVPWLAMAGACIGLVVGWLSLWPSPVLHAGWSEWLHSRPSTAAFTLLLVVAGMSLLGLGWGLAESDD